MAANSNTALIVAGPTGVGKTAVSVEIAKRIPCEIVSADSRQIYRFMDIGTSKPSEAVLQSIPHHFISILNPDKVYSAGQYSNEARESIMQIFERRKLPLVVGGSGLYIRALLEGFFGDDFRDDSIREQLQTRLQEKGAKALYAELQEADPQGAARIHPNNTKRILRSLEVYHITGKPMSEVQKTGKDTANFNWIKFGLIIHREKLYARINQRVDQMFETGFIAEVRGLLKKGYSPKLNSLNSVGYKEVIRFLQNEINLGRCIELVKQNTRRYAKRQLTWFRKESDIYWVRLDKAANFAAETAERILQQFDQLKQNLIKG